MMSIRPDVKMCNAAKITPMGPVGQKANPYSGLRSSFEQGIVKLQPLESRKIPVCCPEFFYPMLQTYCHDTRVMDLRAGDLAGIERRT